MSEKNMVKQITSLIQEGEDSFLFISQGEYYVQLSLNMTNMGAKISAIAVSNAHLLPKDQLPPDQLAQITKLGFTEEPKSKNYLFSCGSKPEELKELAQKILEVFKIYKVNPAKLEFDLS
jgi:hypothetical protein